MIKPITEIILRFNREPKAEKRANSINSFVALGT